MHREYVRWYSPSLQHDMELLVFGHGGFPVLVFPTSYGRFYEYEDRGMVHALSPRIEEGSLQLYCMDSVDGESWYNQHAPPAHRVHRQMAFDDYLTYEVLPFVRGRNASPTLGTTGCSFGGYHAFNFALRHPDAVSYAVSMCGAFRIPQRFLDGYYDENTYFHAPADYLPNMTDEWFLSRYRRNYYVLATGEHDPLKGENFEMAHLLGIQHIPHMLDVWSGFGHDWPWWQQMARKFFQ